MSAFTTVIVRISRTKAKRLTVGEQLGNSRFRTKRRNKFACSKISSSLSSMLFALIFPREHNARVHLTFPLNEMYGYSRLCDRLRSSAIIWKQLSLRPSAIVCDLRSAIVCDHMETSLYPIPTAASRTPWLRVTLQNTPEVSHFINFIE